MTEERSRGLRTGFRRDLQGLRALAVVLVVVFHTGYALPGGFIGVDAFFVLSGFLIIGLLDREADQTGSIDLKAFFARRARRLLPALAVVTSVTVVLSTAVVELGDPLRAVTRTAIGASLFIANGVLYVDTDYFAPDAERNPLLHMWSLSVEEQFYFVVPIAFALVLALHRSQPLNGLSRRRAWMLLLAVGSIVSLTLNAAIVDFSVPVPGLAQSMSFAYYAPITRAWQFGAGGILALAVAGKRSATRLPSLRTPGIVILLAAALLLDADSAFPGVRALLPTIGTLFLLVPGKSTSGRFDASIVRALSARPAVFIGDLSYSWYLWHWPAIVLGRAAFGDGAVTTWGAVIVAFGIALLSTRTVEDHFRKDEQLLGVRASRLAAMSIAVPLAVALTVGAVNTRAAEGVGMGEAARPWSRADCHVGLESDLPWQRAECIRGREIDGSTSDVDVLLIGDSHAASLSEGLLAATEQLGLSLGVWTVSGQPPVGSNSWTERFSNLVAEAKPRVVVMATRSTYYVEVLEPGVTSRWTEGEVHADSAAEIWASKVAQGVKDIIDLGPRVVWVHNVPEFDGALPTQFPTLFRPKVVRAISAEQLQKQRGRTISSEQAALSSIAGATSLDPAHVLCLPDCRYADEDDYFYYDSNHLSAAGSRLLTGLLVEALREALEP